MIENHPSRTALRVALRRAAHQLLDQPQVLDDPMALRIIGEEHAAALRADPRRQEDSPLAPYLRAFMAGRSRYAEDRLGLAVQRGVRQYVILGAGLDTFAYRNPYPAETLTVFEVDHPATQSWKRQMLAAAEINMPAGLTFAPVDFETQTLGDGLRNAGYDPNVGTFFSWLGVTPYLSVPTVMATLRFIASAPAGSEVVFDYALTPTLLNPTEKRVFDALAARVALAGEPWQAFFEPEQLQRDLMEAGFSQVHDAGPEEINERYFAGRSDGLRVGTLAHLMSAKV